MNCFNNKNTIKFLISYYLISVNFFKIKEFKKVLLKCQGEALEVFKSTPHPDAGAGGGPLGQCNSTWQELN